MKNKILRLLGWVAVLPAVLACNVYTPFNTSSSVQDILDKVEQCYTNNDINCAKALYLQLPPGDLQNEKLCEVSLTLSGLTLTALINAINVASSSSTGTGPKPVNMLRVVANQLVPWSTAKSTSMADAITYCGAYATNNGTLKLAVLLNSLAFIVDCSLRMAHVDQCQCANDVQVVANCPITGPGLGKVTSGEIADGTLGVIVVAGMCQDDVKQCRTDLQSISASSLSTAGLSALATALSAIPPNLLSSGAAIDLTRDAISQTLVGL